MQTADKPWLSVILPVHHGEEWVGQALASIASQADPGIEILVIDTSSDDATRNIVENYAERLNLRFIDAGDASGCTAKTNLGVRHAQASHVSWLCQDDLWLDGRTAAVRSWITQYPDAVLHLAPSAIVDRSGKTLGVWNCPFDKDGLAIAKNGLLEKLLVQNFVAVVSPIVRRDAWLEVGGIDRDLWYTGDWDLWVKLACHGGVRYHEQVTGGFRIHDQSATSIGSVDDKEFESQHLTVIDRYIDELRAESAARVRSMAEASIHVNVALASAAHGDVSKLPNAVWAAVKLGPSKLVDYVQYSRILERSLPRVRAKMSGSL